jgi:hypothetical protein
MFRTAEPSKMTLASIYGTILSVVVKSDCWLLSWLLSLIATAALALLKRQRLLLGSGAKAKYCCRAKAAACYGGVSLLLVLLKCRLLLLDCLLHLLQRWRRVAADPFCCGEAAAELPTPFAPDGGLHLQLLLFSSCGGSAAAAAAGRRQVVGPAFETRTMAKQLKLFDAV